MHKRKVPDQAAKLQKHFWILAFIAATAFVISGCSGGGGGSGGNAVVDDGGNGEGNPSAENPSGVSISGSVKNISANAALSRTAGRVSYAAAPAVADAMVEVRADVDGDGEYSADELFASKADDNGNFSLLIPTEKTIPRLTVTTRAAGYSDFVKTFEDVDAALKLVAAVSEGTFNEINIAGISASPARAGRVALAGDETVTIKLFDNDRSSGRRTGRATLSRRGTPSNDGEAPLVEVSFPVRGLKVSAGSEKMYANIAYLDTVADPAVMPGDFKTEGSGEAPMDMLKTFGASQIELFDENGNKLLDNPLDRSKNDVRIKIAVPKDAYASLEDENADTADMVEVPFFYYDEFERQWKSHTNADGTPNLAHLEDNFGNILTAEDLADLQYMVETEDGSMVSSYQPTGSSDDDVVIYSVGMVHHFSTYNCDKRGRVNGYWYEVIGPDGKTIRVWTRYRKKNGAYGSDSDNGKGDGKNVHTFRPEDVANAVQKLLSKDPAVRQQWLDWVLKSGNPHLIQAITNGVRNYAMEHRSEWAKEGNDLLAGLRALFNNKWTTDAVIDTTDLDTGALDCVKTPDICKGIISRTAEEIKRSSDAKKAVALLMQIAVDSYNPGNLNMSYVMDKGLDMIDLAVQSGNAGGQLKTINAYLQKAKNAKNLFDTLKGRVENAGKVWPPPEGSADWSEYAEYISDFKTAMQDMKDTAGDLGRSLSRRELDRRAAARNARPGRNRVARTAVELDEDVKEAVYSYEELGGVLYGASKFSQFQWGYWKDGEFIQVDAPAGLAGGNEIGVLEYFDGSEWIPLPGRSSTGVDASHIPVPNVTSFGLGTPESPVSNLGVWTLDSIPSLAFSGRLVGEDGKPLGNANKIPVLINGNAFHPDANAQFSGEVPVLGDQVELAIPGQYPTRITVSGESHDFGDITLGDRIIFNDPDASAISVNKNEPIGIDAGAYTFSGAAVSYEFSVVMGYYGNEPTLTESNSTGLLYLEGYSEIVTNTVKVEATAPGGLKASRYIRIQVVNQNPAIDSINMSSTTPTAGDQITVDVDVSDPDGDDDVRSAGLYGWCVDALGGRHYLAVRQGESEGKRTWTVDTGRDQIYKIDADEIACALSASVRDNSWGQSSKEATFTLAQKHADPEVAYAYLYDNYDVTYKISVHPTSIRFKDLNSDIVEYSVDCGLGDGPLTGAEPIRDMDPGSEGEQACVYAPGETEQTYTFTAKATDSRGAAATFTSTIRVFAPIDIGIALPNALAVAAPGELLPGEVDGGETNQGDFDLVELPSPDEDGKRSFSLEISASSENGDKTLSSFSFGVDFQPAYSYWSQRMISGDMDATSGTGAAAVEISKPGRYWVSVYATDNAGLYASSWKIFDVTAPFDFEPTINNKTGDEIAAILLTNQAVFGAEIIDEPTGFTGEYAWEVKYEGDADFSSAGTESTLVFTGGNPMPEGTHAVRLTLSNKADATQPPVVHEIEATVYDPITATLGSDYVFYQSAEDPETDTVALGDSFTLNLHLPDGVNLASARWFIAAADGSSADGKYNTLTSGGASTRTFLFNEAGTYLVSVLVKDDRGLTTSAASGTITVREYPPEIDSLAANESNVSPGTETTVAASATDVDGQIVNYIWKISGSYANASGQTVNVNETYVLNKGNSTTPAQLSYTPERQGTFKISLIVEDDDGRKSSESSVEITSAYKAPTITSLAADPASGKAPLSTTFTALAEDSDGEITSYSWDIGDDGVYEQTGSSATFSKSFTAPGSYSVKLTVTDSQGKTASKTVSVYVYDPNAATTFQFKELRSDGLGPDMDFTVDPEQQHYHEMFGKWVAPGIAAVLDPDAMTKTDMAPVLEGTTGFNGFYQADYGVYLYLFQINEGGAYEVGLFPSESAEEGISAALPQGSGCGQNLGAWGDPAEGPISVYPGTNMIDVGDNYHVAATVGAWDGETCTLNGYAYASGATANLTLAEISSRALPELPDFTLNSINFSGGGLNLQVYNTASLLTDEEDRKLIPILPEADLELIYSRSTETSSQTLTIKVPAADLKGSGVLSLGLPAINTTAAALTGVPARGYLRTYSTVGNFELKTEIQIKETDASADAGELTGAVGAKVEFSPYDTSVAPSAMDFVSDLGEGISVMLLGSSLKPINVTVNVNPAGKTLTVEFQTTATLCAIDVNTGYSEGQYMDIHLLSNGSTGSHSMSYILPDMEQFNWETMETELAPGTDALSSASVNVFCADPVGGYETALRTLLGDLGYTNWYKDDFIGLIDAYHQAPTVTWPTD